MIHTMRSDQNRDEPQKAVIGWPVTHSLSPWLYKHWLDDLGLPGSYDHQAINPGHDQEQALHEGLSRLVSAGIDGVNVTVPYKETAFSLSTCVSPRAQRCRAVNRLDLAMGPNGLEITADNTDIEGLMWCLAGLEIEASGTRVVVLGSGGTARAALIALMDWNPETVVVAVRRVEKARQMMQDLLAPDHWRVIGFDDLDQQHLGSELIVVNTVPFGLTTPMPDRWIRSIIHHQPLALIDAVYGSERTPLQKGVGQTEATVIDGLSLLAAQAVPCFRHWFAPDMDDHTASTLITPELIDQLRMAAQENTNHDQ